MWVKIESDFNCGFFNLVFFSRWYLDPVKRYAEASGGWRGFSGIYSNNLYWQGFPGFMLAGPLPASALRGISE